MNIPLMAFLLVAGHAVADYPLQGEFLAMGKSRAKPSPLIPWYQALAAHAMIHGAFVAIVTGIWWLGVAEAVSHAFIDDRKCCGKLTFNQDQALHMACKLIWLIIAALLPTGDQ